MKAMRHLIQVAICLAIGLSAGAAFAIDGPKAKLWPRWQAHDPNSTEIVDHSVWTAFLQNYLRRGENGINRVAYGEVVPQDQAALAGYLESLQNVAVSSLNRNEQFAFWVNLYNATTVKVVLDHYPVDSIRKIRLAGALLFVGGPWRAKLLTVEGEALSLDDIEHRILRPIWRDPRIHYAVNCAAVSCPNLARAAYDAQTLDDMLNRAASQYINHPRGVWFDRRGRLKASSIYDWYDDDFGDTEADLIAHFKEYAIPELREKLDQADKISGYRYDWDLNDATGHAPI